MTQLDRDPWWWRVLAWLPERLFIDCAVCFFWRGVIVGIGFASWLALMLLVIAEV